MFNVGKIVSRAALAAVMIAGILAPAALASDLSKYREFQLGSDLATVTNQTAGRPTTSAVIQTRPALIQTLTWRPQSLGQSSKAEAAQEVVFSFYGGALYRIAVNYDRYETEGLTADDLVEAMSVDYGTPVKSFASPTGTAEPGGDTDSLVARWEDAQHRLDLVRSSYGPTYRLIGVLKSLEAPVQASIHEAKRLDDQEAPQREAARLATEQEASKSKLDKVRLANKAKFRP
jgi:hypothetical protein